MDFTTPCSRRSDRRARRSDGAGADPGFILGGSALVSCSTSTPINHIVSFFCRIPVVLENRKSSQGGGVRTPCTLPLDPPLRWGANANSSLIQLRRGKVLKRKFFTYSFIPCQLIKIRSRSSKQIFYVLQRVTFNTILHVPVSRYRKIYHAV